MLRSRLLWVVSLCCFGWPAAAQDINTLLQRVPDSANMLVVVDVNSLNQTNLAAKEGWVQQRNLDYLSGKTSFPPSVKSVVVGSHLNLASHQPEWKIGLMQFANPVDPYVLAKREAQSALKHVYPPTVPSRAVSSHGGRTITLHPLRGSRRKQ